MDYPKCFVCEAEVREGREICPPCGKSIKIRKTTKEHMRQVFLVDFWVRTLRRAAREAEKARLDGSLDTLYPGHADDWIPPKYRGINPILKQLKKARKRKTLTLKEVKDERVEKSI